MAQINIDGKNYEFDQLTEQAKANLASLQFVDQEIRRLQAHLAALQTARIAYGNALSKELSPDGLSGEVIKFF